MICSGTGSCGERAFTKKGHAFTGLNMDHDYCASPTLLLEPSLALDFLRVHDHISVRKSVELHWFLPR
jgi:hypothetical protein